MPFNALIGTETLYDQAHNFGDIQHRISPKSVKNIKRDKNLLATLINNLHLMSPFSRNPQYVTIYRVIRLFEIIVVGFNNLSYTIHFR